LEDRLPKSLNFAACLACLLAFAASAPGQEPAPSPSPEAPAAETPTFAAGVEQVTVDTVVVDKKGNPVKGLKAADFTVFEDGDPQEVVNFEAIQLPAAPSAQPARKPIISTNQRKEDRTGRTFVIVFDDLQMTRFQGKSAKGAIAEFLKTGVREGDRVSLVATGGGAWWSTRMEAGRDEVISLLKRLDGRLQPDFGPDRMSDYEAMRVQVYNDPEVTQRVSRRFESQGASAGSSGRNSGLSNALGDPMVRGRASEVYFRAVTRNRITLNVMERVLDSLQTTKGRKSMLLVSQGFIYDPNLAEFKEVVQSSRRSNTAIYFIDSRGLTGLGDLYSAEFGAPIDAQDVGASLLDNGLAAEGSESLAADTGGFTVKNTNDLAKGIGRIAAETLSYYMIGYNPTNTKQDGRFRKIEVKLDSKLKGLKVRARKGYYAPLEGKGGKQLKPGENDPAIQQALDAPYELDTIPMRMTAYSFDEALLGKLNALVAADIDLRGFAFEEAEGRAVDTLEFLMVVAHRESGEFFQYSQKVEMRLLPGTRARLERTWFSLSRDFELAPGGYQAKLVVRDKNSGRVGTVIHEFDVPDPAEFRASTLNLSDTLEVKGEGASKPPQPAFMARREFPAGETLYAQFSVYGAEREKGTAMPRVSAGFEIRGSDGLTRARVNPTVINPTSLGKLSRLVGTPLDYEPGVYEFTLNLKDEVTGKTLQIKEPFTVTAKEAPAAASAAP
jgi:VWFA-related protein